MGFCFVLFPSLLSDMWHCRRRSRRDHLRKPGWLHGRQELLSTVSRNVAAAGAAARNIITMLLKVALFRLERETSAYHG